MSENPASNETRKTPASEDPVADPGTRTRILDVNEEGDRGTKTSAAREGEWNAESVTEPGPEDDVL